MESTAELREVIHRRTLQRDEALDEVVRLREAITKALDAKYSANEADRMLREALKPAALSAPATGGRAQ